MAPAMSNALCLWVRLTCVRCDYWRGRSRIWQMVLKVGPEVVGDSVGLGIGNDTNYKGENRNRETG